MLSLFHRANRTTDCSVVTAHRNVGPPLLVRTDKGAAISSFRQKFANRETLIGTFIKTPTTHATEIIGGVGFDFVVIDEEHAPFDRLAIDVCLLAARASGLAGLVRVANAAPSTILSALDCGATGLLVPHVATAAKARDVAASARYRGGRRGYSGSVRPAGFGTKPMWSFIDESDAQTTVIAQIEDPEALDEIDAIAGVDGIDGLFIGRGDMTAAFGAPSNDAPQIRDAVERIAKAADKAGKPVAVFISNKVEASWLREYGATTFVVGSDQSFLRRGAASALSELRPAAAEKPKA